MTHNADTAAKLNRRSFIKWVPDFSRLYMITCAKGASAFGLSVNSRPLRVYREVAETGDLSANSRSP